MHMPQIPPLMIQGISFVHLYNEGQLSFGWNFRILTFKFYVLFKKMCRSVLSGLKTKGEADGF